VFASRALELWRRAVGVRDVEVWRYGAREAPCRCVDMKAWSSVGVGDALLLCLPEAMRCMLLCMLEAVEGRLCLLECWRCWMYRR